MSSIVHALREKRNYPKPVTQSLAGKTVLITGATSGLGLEAAKKLVALDADKVIITARNDSKGQIAKKQIEEFVAAQPGRTGGLKSQLIVLTLDMSSFAGVRKFVDTLKAQFPVIDAAILNAGTILPKWEPSEDGWEGIIQVNALSTFLLGLLLTPLLIASADSERDPAYKPHLTFVSSDTAWSISSAKEKAWAESEDPLAFITAEQSFPAGVPGMSAQYARSKFILESIVRQWAVLPFNKNADGQPKVIISTTCPGMTRSDLGRSVENPIIRFVAWLVFFLLARETEQGANSYISSLLQGDKLNGEMWKNDIKYPPGEWFQSEEGRKLEQKLWLEIRQVILKVEPSTKPFLLEQ